MVLARVLAVSPDSTSLATMFDILSHRCIIEQMCGARSLSFTQDLSRNSLKQGYIIVNGKMGTLNTC